MSQYKLRKTDDKGSVLLVLLYILECVTNRHICRELPWRTNLEYMIYMLNLDHFPRTSFLRTKYQGMLRMRICMS